MFEKGLTFQLQFWPLIYRTPSSDTGNGQEKAIKDNIIIYVGEVFSHYNIKGVKKSWGENQPVFSSSDTVVCSLISNVHRQNFVSSLYC